METKTQIPPVDEHNHEGAPCTECPEENKESEPITVKMDFSNEFNELKQQLSTQVKELKQELQSSLKDIVKDILKTKVTIGNLKAPKYETRKEEPNPFLELMKSTI